MIHFVSDGLGAKTIPIPRVLDLCGGIISGAYAHKYPRVVYKGSGNITKQDVIC